MMHKKPDGKDLNQDRFRVAYERGYRVTDDGWFRQRSGKLVKPKLPPCHGKLDKRGRPMSAYPSFGISVEGRAVRVPLHRFAAYCFYGEEMFNHECVRHVNGDRLDISRDNLVLGSFVDNRDDTDRQQPGMFPKAIRKMWSRSHKVRKLRKKYGSTPFCADCDSPKDVKDLVPDKRSARGFRCQCLKCCEAAKAG